MLATVVRALLLLSATTATSASTASDLTVPRRSGPRGQHLPAGAAHFEAAAAPRAGSPESSSLLPAPPLVYELSAFGRRFQISLLRPEASLPGPALGVHGLDRAAGGEVSAAGRCFYSGTVRDVSDPREREQEDEEEEVVMMMEERGGDDAASRGSAEALLSVCGGLGGSFRHGGRVYAIRPLAGSRRANGDNAGVRPHLITRGDAGRGAETRLSRHHNAGAAAYRLYDAADYNADVAAAADDDAADVDEPSKAEAYDDGDDNNSHNAAAAAANDNMNHDAAGAVNGAAKEGHDVTVFEDHLNNNNNDDADSAELTNDDNDHDYDNDLDILGGGRAAEERSSSSSGLTAAPVRTRRFVSTLRYLSVLLVADDSMARAHGAQNVEQYLLGVAARAARIYSHASLDNAVRLSVAGVVVLPPQQPGARGSPPAASSSGGLTLRNFCEWQKSLRRTGGAGAERFDTAVLFTRVDICGASDCTTLGVADVGTVCDPARSCAVIEDDGVQTAFTLAHELGHLLGLPHDDSRQCGGNGGGGNSGGSGGGAQPGASAPGHIMGETLTRVDPSRPWSTCSARHLTDFLDNGHGDCLKDNTKHGKWLALPTLPQGALLSHDAQCRAVFGTDFRHCALPGEAPCVALWCRNATAAEGPEGAGGGPAAEFLGCQTRHSHWADGTACGAERQCSDGRCVDSSSLVQVPVDGEWGAWGAWSECSRSCGGGVQLSSRGCDAPEPQHGGAYCVGQRVQYRSCNTQSCGHSEMRYREEQCAAHDGRHAGLPGLGDAPVQWAPKYAGVATKDQCKLVCRARSSAFYAVLAQRVRDGTPCSPGVQGVCVSGRCLRTGCDRVIGSRRRFDRCGRCGGDGSACRRVSGSFTPKRFGYSDAVTVPAGATSLKVWRKSEREARAYLALRDARGEPLLNGAYTVAPGRTLVPLGGVTLAYSGWAPRGETLRLLEPGAALPEPLAVQVLLTSAGASVRVRYEYHVPADGRPAREGRGDGGNDDERSNEIEAAPPPPPPPAAMTAGGDEDAARAARAKTLKQQGATLVRHAKGRSDAAPGEGGGGGGSNRLAATGDAAGGEPGAERWAAGPWRSCTRQCGGWQRREVRCVGAGGVGAAHGLCPLGGRPAAFRACLAQSCPPV